MSVANSNVRRLQFFFFVSNERCLTVQCHANTYTATIVYSSFVRVNRTVVGYVSVTASNTLYALNRNFTLLLIKRIRKCSHRNTISVLPISGAQNHSITIILIQLFSGRANKLKRQTEQKPVFERTLIHERNFRAVNPFREWVKRTITIHSQQTHRFIVSDSTNINMEFASQAPHHFDSPRATVCHVNKLILQQIAN